LKSDVQVEHSGLYTFASPHSIHYQLISSQMKPVLQLFLQWNFH